MFKNALKAIVAVSAIAGIAAAVYFGFFSKTDVEKICDTLEKFETAYEQGDISKCLSCLDSKSRNGMKGAASLGGSIAGMLGFDLGSDAVGSLFGVAVAAQNPKLHFEVKEINFTDDKNAKVSAILHSSGLYATKDTSEKISFEMVKEGSDWFMVEDFSLF